MSDQNSSIDQEKMAFMQRVQTASVINSDHIAPNIFQMLGYRQAIAQSLLREEEGSERYNHLKGLFEYTESDLKKLIGIK